MVIFHQEIHLWNKNRYYRHASWAETIFIHETPITWTWTLNFVGFQKQPEMHGRAIFQKLGSLGIRSVFFFFLPAAQAQERKATGSLSSVSSNVSSSPSARTSRSSRSDKISKKWSSKNAPQNKTSQPVIGAFPPTWMFQEVSKRSISGL